MSGCSKCGGVAGPFYHKEPVLKPWEFTPLILTTPNIVYDILWVLNNWPIGKYENKCLLIAMKFEYFT